MRKLRVLLVSFRKCVDAQSLRNYTYLEITNSISTNTLMGYLSLKDDINVELKHIEIFYVWPEAVMNECEVFQSAADYEPDVIAVSLFNVDYKVYQKLHAFMKQRQSETVWVGGGYLPTGNPSIILDGTLDFLILSHGEVPLYLLLKHLSTGFPSLAEIPNLVTKDREARLRTNPVRVFPREERTAKVVFEPFNKHRYVKESWQIPSISKMVYATTWFSRGCVLDCAFCENQQINRGKVLLRPAEAVLNEIIELNQKQGANFIFFADENFLLFKNKVRELLKGMIKLGLPEKVRFTFMTSINSIVKESDEELLSLLKEAGCEEIQFGVESGSQRMLDKMNKETELEDAYKAFARTAYHGIPAAAMLVLGYGGETLESLGDTYDFIHRLAPDRVTFAFYTPFHGTATIDNENPLKDVPMFLYNSDFPILPIESLEKELQEDVVYEDESSVEKVLSENGLSFSSSQKYLLKFRRKLMHDYYSSFQFRRKQKEMFDRRTGIYNEDKEELLQSAGEWFTVLGRSISEEHYADEMMRLLAERLIKAEVK